MATYTQETRRIAVETPLGKDALLLTTIVGHEEMSRLFGFDLDFLSEKDSIDPKSIVGKNITFSVQFADESWRYFNGHVKRFAYCGRDDRLNVYRAEVVPWLWFLTRTSDCRIFQGKTVPDIIEQIFKDLGFTHYKMDCKEKHPWLEYCVQYRETDFNFVSRLMEEEGIFYFFKHENGKHTLIISDHKGAYIEGKDADVVRHKNWSSPAGLDNIHAWEHHHEYRSGKWAHTDYNFETPSTSLMATTNSVVSLDGNGKLEFYDFPGEQATKAVGDASVKIRMQEEETPHDRVHGEGWCRSFSPGVKFKVKKHFIDSEVGKGYVITQVRHVARVGGGYVTTTEAQADELYRNHFTCIPDSVTYRPQRITPEPVIHGSQTAVVVGPKGEEIYTDKYGRIKVQFHWDREGKKDDKTSCWIRCSQISAGKNWGVMSIPRIGQEVVVSYLEGDPDCPLVTGVVYNAEQMPAYTLPDEKTKSYIKTNTSLGGDGYNEIRFEDKKDKEQIYIHAEKNMDIRVKNDCMERVVNNRHEVVGWEKDGKKGGDQYELYYQDVHVNIKRNKYEHIEGCYELKIGKGEAKDGGNSDLYIEKNRTECIGKSYGLSVKEDYKVKVDGGVHFTIGGDHHEKTGKLYALEAGQEIHLKAGTKIIIEAPQVCMKGAGGFVDVGLGGVTIQGTMVKINSGGAAGTGSGASPQAPPDCKQAAPKKATKADNSKTGYKSCSDGGGTSGGGGGSAGAGS
ncbi:MAG: type VI secretion system tip protein VgrG [Pirellulales bacterium]